MRKHPVRKFIGLTVLYAVIIVGIFVLQFKTESVLQKTIGAMRVSLAQTQTESEELRLKNQLQVSYRGLVFTANENTPAIVADSAENGNTHELVLASFAETPLAIQFNFNDGSKLIFALSDETENALLLISATPSAGYDTMYVPYKITNLRVQERTANRTILTAKNSKGLSYSLSAPQMDEQYLILNAHEGVATYSSYDPAKHFEYSAVADLSLTDSATYETNVKQLRAALVTSMNSILGTSAADNLTENEVVAYVAEMAATNRYNLALDSVPDSFKKGNRRTYISAPYFDNLAVMDRSLNVQTELYRSQVQTALSSGSLDVFTVPGIEDYMLRQKHQAEIKNLAAMPALQAKAFEPTIPQAAGIINVYTSLYSKDSSLASLLEPIIENCTQSIAHKTKLQDGIITITENEVPLSVEQNVKTGYALIQLGKLTGKTDFANTGRLLVNQQLSHLEDMRLQTLAEIYPVLVRDNTFYPHTEVLGYYGASPVWAWTCATSLDYSIKAQGIVNINIDFPQNFTHYLIIKGVPTFHARIEIQSQMFRSDPRFETYNSSGYVYEANTKSLYLKSRHKSKAELVRLFCDPADNFAKAGR